MNVEIEIDLSGLLQLEDAANELAPAMERVVDRAAAIAFNAKLKEIDKTYGRPVPTKAQVAAYDRKGGKKKRPKKSEIGQGGEPAWPRSDNWKAGQKIEKRGQFERAVVDSGPASEPITNHPGGYAEKLAKLPTGALGINRSNPAAEKAHEKTEAQVEAVVNQELNNVFHK